MAELTLNRSPLEKVNRFFLFNSSSGARDSYTQHHWLTSKHIVHLAATGSFLHLVHFYFLRYLEGEHATVKSP